MRKRIFGSENELSYAEVHAVILGGVVGALVGYAHVLGRTTVAIGVGAFFVGVAFGVGSSERGVPARRTIRREPWYALAAFLTGGAAVLFGNGVAGV